MHRYQFYDCLLESAFRLRCANSPRRADANRPPDITLLRGRQDDFLPFRNDKLQALAGAWLRYISLPDGRDYLRWQRTFEFLVDANGRRILGRPLSGSGIEALDAFLLGHALSFAFLKQGRESLHATVVVSNNRAVALMGDCGMGKSTLAAACLCAGWSLLTDDLLMVKPKGEKILSYPGPPRLKLTPEVARRFLGTHADGMRVDRLTGKLSVPLPPESYTDHAVELAACVVLAPPSKTSQAVSLRRLTTKAAWEELTKNTFNLVVQQTPRLKRLFEYASTLAERVPTYSLAYPMGLDQLPKAVETLKRVAGE